MTVRVLFSNLARPGRCASVVKKVKALVLESALESALESGQVLESVSVSALELESGQALLSVLESVLVSALAWGGVSPANRRCHTGVLWAVHMP